MKTPYHNDDIEEVVDKWADMIVLGQYTETQRTKLFALETELSERNVSREEISDRAMSGNE